MRTIPRDQHERAPCGKCGDQLVFATDGNGTVLSHCPTCKQAELREERRSSEPGRRATDRTPVYVGDLAVWLKSYRDRHGLSRDSMARKCGITPPTVLSLETGRARPRPMTRTRVEQAFGIEIVDAPVPAATTGPLERTREAIVKGRERSRLIGALTALEEAMHVLHSVVAELV